MSRVGVRKSFAGVNVQNDDFKLGNWWRVSDDIRIIGYASTAIYGRTASTVRQHVYEIVHVLEFRGQASSDL